MIALELVVVTLSVVTLSVPGRSGSDQMSEACEWLSCPDGYAICVCNSPGQSRQQE
jgi:hypothetical protein